jgi:hypothetical protein
MKGTDIMAWEVVKIPTSSRGRTSPYASVGFGKLSLSAAACELIDNYEGFTYVQLLKNRVNNRLCIGVLFLKEASLDSIKISRKKMANGKLVGGIEVANSRVLESLFGLAATAKKTTRYDVKKDDAYPNFLVVFAE